MKVFAFLVAFCVPLSAIAQERLDDDAPFAGLELLEADKAQQLFENADLPARMIPKRGMMVVDAYPWAMRQGARPLDMILNVDRRRVADMSDWETALQGKSPGDTVDVRFKRFVGVWRTMNGSLQVTSRREAAYDALEIQGSRVSGGFRGEHTSLSGEITVLSPVITVSEDGTPHLFLKVRWRGDNWLFVEKVSLRSQNDNRASVPVSVFERKTKVFRDGSGVMETTTLVMPDDVETIIREPFGTSIDCRFDGETTYVERPLTQEWHSRAKAVLQVYDDIVARDDPNFFFDHAD